MDQPSDRDLVARCLAGQADAYTGLVKRYQRPLLARLRGELRGAREAEELAQEIFTRAYFSLNRLRDHDAFFPWLLAIADRVLLEHFRSQRRDRKRVELTDDHAVTRPVESDHAALERAVSRLPAQYRQVILLRYYGGYSCAEVALRLKVEVGTVTKSLSRAYAMLREQLGISADQPARPEAKP